MSVDIASAQAATPPPSAKPEAAKPEASKPEASASAKPVAASRSEGASPQPGSPQPGSPAPASPAADEPAAAEGEAPAPRRRGRPKGSTARTTRTVLLTLTVSGTADGDWQAELKNGSSWIARELPVSAAAVSRAAGELHADLAAHVDEVIGSAREQRAARVAALEAELAEARKALAEVDV